MLDQKFFFCVNIKVKITTSTVFDHEKNDRF